ncbi:unnamed protein product, partial [marine sediment metagenome]
KIFAIIMHEREYQIAQQEGGRFQVAVHTVGEELLLMKRYLDKAIAKYADNFGDAPALHGIRKVAALAVRCMENHGALPREEGELEKKETVEEMIKKEEEDEVPF